MMSQNDPGDETTHAGSFLTLPREMIEAQANGEAMPPPAPDLAEELDRAREENVELERIAMARANEIAKERRVTTFLEAKLGEQMGRFLALKVANGDLSADAFDARRKGELDAIRSAVAQLRQA